MDREVQKIEFVLCGVSIISHNTLPNTVENYLVRNNLVKKVSNSQKIMRIIEKYIESYADGFKKIKELKKIENSIQKLLEVI